MPKEDLVKGTLLVKFVDDAGLTLGQNSRSFLGVKELSTVVIRGRIRREDDSSLFVVANGIYVKKK